MKLSSVFLVSLLVPAFVGYVAAQDGNGPPAGGTSAPTSYSCPSTTCKLPACNCASATPPGGISAQQAPQFVTLTLDDAVQDALLNTTYHLLSHTKNPNGCQGKATFFVSIQYTNFHLVTQWYANGNEVADHTINHVGSPPPEEISGCHEVLSTYAGINRGHVKGFRAPFLNYTATTLKELGQQGFTYDSSATSLLDDAWWPYTLDYGLANDCYLGFCNEQTKIPGFWEIPMAATFDATSQPHLMDPYLDAAPDLVLSWLKTNFDRHYNGNRAPFGVYIHPVHLGPYPGLPDPAPMVNMITSFFDYASSKADVWFVTNQQLLQYVQNPVTKDKVGEQQYMQCHEPVVGKPICNGMSGDSSLVQSCNVGSGLSAVTYNTCYQCPSQLITLQTPVSPAPSGDNRAPPPDDCDTVWWDPIAKTCLCTNSSCSYKDLTQPINIVKGSAQPAGTGSNGTTSNPSGSGAFPTTVAPFLLFLVVLTFSFVAMDNCV